MAGRPSTGSTTGIVVGMCIALAVAVISLVLLVVLWTKQEDMENARSKAVADAQRVMSPSERTGALSTWYDKGKSGKSAARLMSLELQAYSELVDGNADSVQPETVAGIRDDVLAALYDRINSEGLVEAPSLIIDKPLMEALSAMYALYSSQVQAKTDADNQVRALTAEVATLAEANQAMQTAFDEQANALQTQVADIEADRDRFRQDKNAELTEVKDHINARITGLQESNRELQDELSAGQHRLAKAEEAQRRLQQRIREFQIKPLPGGKARESDGEIMLAQPGSDVVFVDLGRDQNLTLGLRFAVYPPDRFIPRSGRAKAAIEVVSVGDQVSECRVVWSTDINPIIKGDIIANPIYDRDRRLNFYVMGEFDLNHDGVDDRYGRETIEAVIMDAGGVVRNELNARDNARIDFMIVGAAAAAPSASSTNPTAEEIAIVEEYNRRLAEYGQQLQDARTLSIPMLTQESFLDFLGRR
jgi:hypothetical protein